MSKKLKVVQQCGIPFAKGVVALQQVQSDFGKIHSLIDCILSLHWCIDLLGICNNMQHIILHQHGVPFAKGVVAFVLASAVELV